MEIRCGILFDCLDTNEESNSNSNLYYEESLNNDVVEWNTVKINKKNKIWLYIEFIMRYIKNKGINCFI